MSIGAALKQAYPEAEFEVNEETGEIRNWKPGAPPNQGQIAAAIAQYDPPVPLEDLLDEIALFLEGQPGAPAAIIARARQARRRNP